MRIAISGATGFVGRHLVDWLIEHTEHQIVCVSRSNYQSQHPRVECRQGDFYSLLDSQRLLEDCDAGIYLVHSMSPHSRLSQGHFRDFDFILADNFAKAAEKNGLHRIVYVSGIIPEGVEQLSPHLESRLEVEQTFAAHQPSLVSLRCGIVLGPGGSSFEIIQKLLERLPIIALPKWTRSLTQSVYIDDLMSIITDSLLLPTDKDYVFDVGMPERIPYGQLLKRGSKILGSKNVFIPLPIIPRFLSKLWVSVITGASRELVYPLIDSLVYPMVTRAGFEWPQPPSQGWTNLNEALERSLKLPPVKMSKLKKIASNEKRASLVQSVQRLPFPSGWTIREVAIYYLDWLPKFLWPFLRTEKTESMAQIYFGFLPQPLLELEVAPESTFEGRSLFRIRGGVLARKNKKARLEFRLSPHKDFFIAAIHSYEPSLPWFIYQNTQAKFHALVMACFGRKLKNMSTNQRPNESKD